MFNKTPYPYSIPCNQASPRKLQTTIHIPEESSEPQLYSIKGIDSQRHKRPQQTAINIPG